MTLKIVEQKAALFGFLFILLVLGGILLWQALFQAINFNRVKSLFSDINLFKAEVGREFDFVGTLPNLEMNNLENKTSLPIFQELETDKKQEIKETEKLEEEIDLRNFQEVLDDVGEEIDTIRQEIAVLLEKEKEENMTGQSKVLPETELTPDKNNEIKEDKKGELESLEEEKSKPSSDDQVGKTKQEVKEIKEEKKEIEIRRGGGGGPTYCQKILDSEPSLNKVIISELGWMGTDNSSNDEWIELKNISLEEVSLSDWQLVDKEKQIKIIFPEKTIIGPGDFFLLERTDENSLPNISADLIYTGALNNTDEAIYLFNQECELQDEAIASPNWQAGQEEEKKSMERKLDFGWQTFQGEQQAGIKGTPKAENSQPQPQLLSSSDTPQQESVVGQEETNSQETGQQEESEQEEDIKDISPPFVYFNLGSSQSSISFAVSWDIVDFATPAQDQGFSGIDFATGQDSGIAGFILRWKEEDGPWSEEEYSQLEGNPLQYSGTRVFQGKDGKSYYFQIKSKDSQGNENKWLPEPPASTRVILPKRVLLNEIQIDSKVGTGGANDDWAELYNLEEYPISLQGWSIQEHSSSLPCSAESGFYKKNFAKDSAIPAKGYFLVADSQAGESLKAIADMTIGWSLTEGNTIYLVNSEEKIEGGDDIDIQDKVGFGNACFPESSSAPNPPEAKSIVRKNYQDTNDNSADFEIQEIPSPVNSKNQTVAILEEISSE